jgi:hypothetical protein
MLIILNEEKITFKTLKKEKDGIKKEKSNLGVL